LLEHWHNEKRTSARKLYYGDGNRFTFPIRLFLCEIRDLHCLLCACHAAKTGPWPRTNYWVVSPHLSKRRRHIMHRDVAETTFVIQMHEAKLCSADTHRIRQHGLKHRLQLAGRA